MQILNDFWSLVRAGRDRRLLARIGAADTRYIGVTRRACLPHVSSLLARRHARPAKPHASTVSVLAASAASRHPWRQDLPWPRCPVTANSARSPKTAEIFADRWTPLIVRDLCFQPCPFCELITALPDTLDSQLFYRDRKNSTGIGNLK